MKTHTLAQGLNNKTPVFLEYKIIAIRIRKAGSVVEPLGETVQSAKAQAAAKKRQESQ